jgi:hypothetical protein
MDKDGLKRSTEVKTEIPLTSKAPYEMVDIGTGVSVLAPFHQTAVM